MGGIRGIRGSSKDRNTINRHLLPNSALSDRIMRGIPRIREIGEIRGIRNTINRHLLALSALSDRIMRGIMRKIMGEIRGSSKGRNTINRHLLALSALSVKSDRIMRGIRGSLARPKSKIRI